MNISIIIPTRNRAPLLSVCLPALLPQLEKRDEIVVVDNASTDNTREYISSLKTGNTLRYVFEPNIGPSFARNHGYRLSKNNTVAFLDDDCVVSDDWLHSIKTTTRSKEASHSVFLGKITHVFPSVGISEDLFLLRHQHDWQLIKSQKSWKIYHYVDFLHAGNFFAKKSVLGMVSPLFDEANFPFIGEERDLVYRLQLQGIPVKYIESASVTHHKTRSKFIPSIRSSVMYGIAQGKLKKRYLADNKIRSLFTYNQKNSEPAESFHQFLGQKYKNTPVVLFKVFTIICFRRLIYRLSENFTLKFYQI